MDALAGSGFGSSEKSTSSKKNGGGKARKGFGKASTISPFEADTSKSIQRLWDTLIDEEECEGLEDVCVGFDTNSKLRGVYAKRAFAPGEYICAIPFVSTLLIDETFYPDLEDGNEEESRKRELELSAARLSNGQAFLEKFTRDPSNFHQAYLDCLPKATLTDTNFAPTPDFWTREEIEQLELPFLVAEFMDRKDQLAKFVSKPPPQSLEGNSPTSPSFDQKELQHAMWLVRSRGFTTLKKALTLDGEDGFLQRTVLIPGMDFLNHEPPSLANANLEVVETKEYDESFYALVAQKAIRPNEAISICYGTGDEMPWELYGKYGFWPTRDPQQEEPSEEEQKQISMLSCEWKTTLEEDIIALRSASGRLKEILDIRIKFKQLQEACQKTDS